MSRVIFQLQPLPHHSRWPSLPNLVFMIRGRVYELLAWTHTVEVTQCSCLPLSYAKGPWPFIFTWFEPAFGSGLYFPSQQFLKLQPLRTIFSMSASANKFSPMKISVLLSLLSTLKIQTQILKIIYLDQFLLFFLEILSLFWCCISFSWAMLHSNLQLSYLLVSL
jgi:hypothetical protein